MPTLDESMRRRLIAKLGTGIDLQSRSDIVADVLRELADGLQRVPSGGFDPGDISAYDKTYTESYNKEDYSRGSYTKYDRTDDGGEYMQLVNEIRPELDRLIIDKLRQRQR